MPTPRRNLFVRWIPIAFVLLLYACTLQQQSESSSSLLAQQCQPQREFQFSDHDLAIKWESGTQPYVAALNFASNGESLLIAYGKDASNSPEGVLVQVQILNNHLARSAALGQLTKELTRITENGNYLISATPKTCTDKVMPSDTCWDVRVWNVTTLQLLAQHQGFNWNLHDIAVSGNGKWLLMAMGRDGILRDLEAKMGGASLGVEYNYDGVIRRIVSGALSAESNLVALGIKGETSNGQFVVGIVRLQEWDMKVVKPITKEGWTIGQQNMTMVDLKVDATPLRMTFAPTDRWLAVQTEKSVSVFDIPSKGSSRTSALLPSSKTGALRFNPSGNLMAVGTETGIRVYNIPDLKTRYDKPTATVTAIAFSPDGCLLAWGDVEGTVHIINAPKP